MSEPVLIVNTHPGPNPEFVTTLAHVVSSAGVQPEIVEGYGSVTPLEQNPSRVILTGVPIDAPYSLADAATRREIDRAFGWLRDCECPVLGICFGHQILAHIFGGEVASLPGLVNEERLRLSWQPARDGGIFADVGSLEVFTEHRDYVAAVPPGFKVLCSLGEVPYIIWHPKKERYGVQFVPEQSDAPSKHILRRFVGR
jgi:GMP synthase (glutamine-hydrolysing)